MGNWFKQVRTWRQWAALGQALVGIGAGLATMAYYVAKMMGKI